MCVMGDGREPSGRDGLRRDAKGSGTILRFLTQVRRTPGSPVFKFNRRDKGGLLQSHAMCRGGRTGAGGGCGVAHTDGAKFPARCARIGKHRHEKGNASGGPPQSPHRSANASHRVGGREGDGESGASRWRGVVVVRGRRRPCSAVLCSTFSTLPSSSSRARNASRPDSPDKSRGILRSSHAGSRSLERECVSVMC